MKTKYQLLSLVVLMTFLFASSCTKIIYRDNPNTSNNRQSPRTHSGAIPDDNKDDTKALQALFNSGLVILSQGIYNVSSTLYIVKYGTVIEGNGAIIRYTGTGAAISSKRVRPHGAYPVNCNISRIGIEILKENSIGLDIKLSHSHISEIRIALTKANSIGIKLSGDPKGTGPYYNMFQSCNVQGKGLRNTIGVLFDFDKKQPSRCPNANSFYGGRMGQLTKGLVIRGAGNTFYSPVLEGIKERCIEFSHPSKAYASISNDVYSPYIEGANGAVVSYFGDNSTQCKVINPYITSIGTKGKKVVNISKSKTNNLSRSD